MKFYKQSTTIICSMLFLGEYMIFLHYDLHFSSC